MTGTNVYEMAADLSIAAIQDAISKMAAKLDAPVLVKTSAVPHFRYRDPGIREALVLKTVRMLSALLSLRALIRAGLSLDAGAIMRILDETGSDIQFLAGPLIFQSKPEKSHERYLNEFFQEEFDHPSPLKSTQKRDRVSRRDIRAYVARTYNAGSDVSAAVAVAETIEKTFSGFIHGAMCHIMDAYDGIAFRAPMLPADDPVEAMADQFSQYVHRALMDTALAAKALGDEDLFSDLYRLQIELFNEWGDYRAAPSRRPSSA
jgi:hypothetical protein